MNTIARCLAVATALASGALCAQTSSGSAHRLDPQSPVATPPVATGTVASIPEIRGSDGVDSTVLPVVRTRAKARDGGSAGGSGRR